MSDVNAFKISNILKHLESLHCSEDVSGSTCEKKHTMSYLILNDNLICISLDLTSITINN